MQALQELRMESDASRLAFNSFRTHLMDIGIWPDNWAASPLLAGAHVSDFLSKIDEPGHRTRTLVRQSRVHTVNEKEFSMDTGTVKFYNDQKGFGFIQPDNGEKDVFVHATALERAGIAGLREGQKVVFDTQNDPRNGKTAVGTIELA
jgi:CspA family cold shock protein